MPDAPARIDGTYEVLPRMASVLEAYRARELPIIHAVRLYKEDGSNVDLCRREAIEQGLRVVAPNTEGAELVRDIRPAQYASLHAERLLNGEFQPVGRSEWAMYKPRWGAFYGTDLERFLRDRGVDTIVFIGCNYPNCPRTSIYEASERDFRIVMVSDAMSQVYEQGIREMRNIGVHVCTVWDVMEAVRSL
ncbi:MAG: cysteine hydrolase [Thermobacillus sp.]|nr:MULTISPECIES: isochorismatase family cysteine hydrolase [Thermobacillus]REK58817.1 MAG: cysteine hydrolase [Thermobacillus sp.]